MYTGIVTHFFPGRPRNHERRGYGFIAPSDGGPAVFFQAAGLQGVSSVPPGAEVSYILVRGTKPGLTQAANVKLVEIEGAP